MKLACLFALILAAAGVVAQQNPTLHIRSFTPELHSTISAADLATIRGILRDFKAEHTNNACPTDMLGEIIGDAFSQTGYFKVRVTEVRCRFVAQTSREDSVALRAKVEPGSRYRLSQITFSQPTVYPLSELRRQIPVTENAIFNVASIRLGLKNLRELYCHQGYINFISVPITNVDEAQHTISLSFDVDEGARFNVGQLTVNGTPSVPGAKERLLAAWKKYEGKPFDCAHTLKQFLTDLHAQPNVDPSRLFQSRVDSQKHVVDFIIVLRKPDSQTTTN